MGCACQRDEAMNPNPDDHPLMRLRQEWLMSGLLFLVLMVIALFFTLRNGEQTDTGVLLGLAGLGVLLFKLGDLVIVAIGELRRR